MALAPNGNRYLTLLLLLFVKGAVRTILSRAETDTLEKDSQIRLNFLSQRPTIRIE